MSTPDPIEPSAEPNRWAEIGRRSVANAERARGDRWLRTGALIHAFSAFAIGMILLGQLSDERIVFPTWLTVALAASAALTVFSAAWSWFENRSPLLVMLLASLAVITTFALAGFFSVVFLANVGVMIGCVRGLLRNRTT